MLFKKILCTGLLIFGAAEAKSVTSISLATQLCREALQPNKYKMLRVSRTAYNVKETNKDYTFDLNATNPEGMWVCNVSKLDGKVKFSEKY